ncbi:MAG: serine/threonine protein kinase [Cyanobacteria bacterium TGS_CYA1]|nr:serine/threonine protein kinase [Cyanobacteria bacterium TGS_CYA1]
MTISKDNLSGHFQNVESHEDVEPGDIFDNKYQIVDKLGAGNVGMVFRAKHLILDKFVAIKVLMDLKGIENSDTNNSTRSSLMRFQREAKAAANLNHPNVITIHDFGIFKDSIPYMVMDLIEGETLSSHMKRNSLPLHEALTILNQICDALAHAHGKNVMHRDLKPGNIMIVNENGQKRAILLDFGLAKFIQGDNIAISVPGEALGTPAYMSPEQARGFAVDHRSDFYSLGCIIYEMFCGQPPLVGKTAIETVMNRLNAKKPDLSAAIFNQYPHIRLLLERLLDKDPENRPDSAIDIKDYLTGSIKPQKNKAGKTTPELIALSQVQSAQDNLKTVVTTPQSPLKTANIQKTGRGRILFLILLAIAALGIAIYIFTRLS